MNPMSDIPVNDIKPLVEVPDYSFYLFLGVVIASLAVALGIAFFVLKRIRSRRIGERERAYGLLCSVDLDEPKKAAYAISRLGYLFARDNERVEKAYQNLFERLERYKYAPSVDPLDEETVGYYRLYIEMIDV